MIILPTMRGVLGRSGGAAPAYDVDAQAWFDAVEATGANFGSSPADILTNKQAFSDWFEGCKTDGIWTAIKAGCFLRGPSTLAGALVPFVGAAPTNVNFVDADYDPMTGLVGNGSTKYLDTNRANNADPQNSRSTGFWQAAIDTSSTTSGHMGAVTDTTSTSGTTAITRSSTITNLATRLANSTATLHTGAGNQIGFHGISRAAAGSFSVRVNGTDYTSSVTSQTPTGTSLSVFRALNIYTNARKSFYWIGESLTLSLLESRLSTLFGALV